MTSPGSGLSISTSFLEIFLFFVDFRVRRVVFFEVALRARVAVFFCFDFFVDRLFAAFLVVRFLAISIALRRRYHVHE